MQTITNMTPSDLGPTTLCLPMAASSLHTVHLCCLRVPNVNVVGDPDRELASGTLTLAAAQEDVMVACLRALGSVFTKWAPTVR